MSVSEILTDSTNAFDKAMSHLQGEYTKLRLGRASSGLVESLPIDVYGVSQPLRNIASISIPDAKTIQITPWDKSNVAHIEKSIRESDLGLTPNNNGQSILLNIPALTEERRKDLVKVVHRMAEEAKITIRNQRQDAMQKFKTMQKNSDITEDDKTNADKKLQIKVDEVNKQIEESVKAKESEIMTV